MLGEITDEYSLHREDLINRSGQHGTPARNGKSNQSDLPENGHWQKYCSCRACRSWSRGKCRLETWSIPRSIQGSTWDTNPSCERPSPTPTDSDIDYVISSLRMVDPWSEGPGCCCDSTRCSPSRRLRRCECSRYSCLPTWWAIPLVSFLFAVLNMDRFLEYNDRYLKSVCRLGSRLSKLTSSWSSICSLGRVLARIVIVSDLK